MLKPVKAIAMISTLTIRVVHTSIKAYFVVFLQFYPCESIEIVAYPCGDHRSVMVIARKYHDLVYLRDSMVCMHVCMYDCILHMLYIHSCVHSCDPTCTCT